LKKVDMRKLEVVAPFDSDLDFFRNR